MPRRSSSYYEDEWYPPSRPRAAKNGIKAKNVRGAFGESWWAKRWIGTLEAFGWGNRLQRGRSYARSGQVLAIDLQTGCVQAKVQGSRATPYKVKIEIPPLTDEQWSRAIESMARQAIFGAKLLAGEMPQDIEDAFVTAGVALLPRSAREIATRCSCPDDANPCKHIAAVYYLLGERFDEDPFLIFHLRGRTRDQVVDALRARRAATSRDVPEQAVAPLEPIPPLAELLDTFYQAGPEIESIAVQITAPEVEAAVLRQLGAAPGGIDHDLQAVYSAMTKHILDDLFGEEETGQS
jgi:uncharacterized Zn finger protein